MSTIQLSQFERFIENDDDAAAVKWLHANFPDYHDEIKDELNFIFNRLRAAAEARREVDVSSEAE